MKLALLVSLVCLGVVGPVPVQVTVVKHRDEEDVRVSSTDAHCKRGHEFSDHEAGKGWRRCMTCRRMTSHLACLARKARRIR
jgi:hypothetical protein